MKMDLNKVVPQKPPMRLIKNVLHFGRDQAVTESVVEKEWPLCEGGAVNPLVLVELVAQNAAVFLGWRILEDRGEDFKGKGWLVGIREAAFHCEEIPVGSTLRTEAREVFDYDSYHEITGEITANGNLLGEVTLQVIETEE